MGERPGSNGGVRTAWVQGKGKERKGRERKGKEGKGRERKGKEGKGRERKGKDGKGRKKEGKGPEGKGMEWTAADGVGAREWLEMGREKKPLVMSELGCADGCGREMGAENCTEGCRRRGCNGVAGNGWGEEAAGDERACLRGRQMGADGKWVRRIAWTAADGVGATEWLEMGAEKKPLVMSELGCADGCGREMGAENCAEGCGRRGCNGVAGNGWGEEAADDERAWLRGRLRTGNGCGEVRRLTVAAWVLVMSELGCADGCGRQMGRGTARVQGSGWGKKPLVMSELGCADGCGREMNGENFADGCGRRGCNGVVGNGWGEEAAGDERAWLRAWLRGRLRTGNGWGELRGRLRTAWVQRSGWKWVGRRTRCSPRTRMLTPMLMYAVTQNNFLQ